MFKKILVPTDFSEKSRAALNIAIEIASQGKGTINVLHVIQTIPHTTFEEFEGFYTKLADTANAEMEKLVALYNDASINIEAQIVFGDRVQEILKFTKEHQIDLIVMNSHKVDFNFPTQGWGTISYKVGALSSCPIMLVK